MTIIITKKNTKEEIKKTLKKIMAERPEKGLRKHFGVSKNKTDAISFQKKVRDEWN